MSPTIHQSSPGSTSSSRLRAVSRASAYQLKPTILLPGRPLPGGRQHETRGKGQPQGGGAGARSDRREDGSL